MPLTRFVADALGVVTICLVGALVLLGLFCTIYSFYFHNRVHGQVWWGTGEILRLNLLRRDGRVLDALNLKWQETRSGTLSPKWNAKTAGYVLLCCLPMFVLQLVVILIGPEYNKENRWHKLPPYFIKAAAASKTKDNDNVALCTYPLLSTIFLGLFATILTTYLFWLGRRILHLVINKGLQKRVYALIFSFSSFLPLRVTLLGLSVLFEPEKLLFDAIAFLAFLSLLCCAGVGICTLVYLPVADSLALQTVQRDMESRRTSDLYNDTISLIANQSPLEESAIRIPRGSLDTSVSFSTTENEEVAFVELSRFTSILHSPQLHQVHGP
ncbi:unnamed protein product [Fraxinus pennsylvanica]|uniref:Transmembrane protein n=1 Tax=Fraxinus pennsylvanica TaxID=56036 RepID=A0AAD1ZGD5_9LAMI|nr:unnamed protein product [Fraxinus pennsylvanica]